MKIKASETLGTFRQRLHEQCENIPVDRQSLSFGHVSMGDNAKTLAQYGVEKDGVIELRDLMD